MVADGKALQVPQALTTAQDAQHCHQQQVSGRDADPTPHTPVRDAPQKAEQVEMGRGTDAVGHEEEAIQPKSTPQCSTNKAPSN